MRSCGTIVVMLVILFATVASAQSPDNAVWGVDERNEVLRWNSALNGFEGIPGSLKQVSVGTDGEVWGVDPESNVLRWTGSQWQQVPGMKLKQLSVRSGQEVWGVDADDHLFRWNGSAWQPTGITSAFVSAGTDGTVWGISAPASGANAGIIQPISNWLNHQGGSPIEGPGAPPVRLVSVTDGSRLWAIDDLWHSYQWTAAGWQRIDGSQYLDVAQATNGELWTVYRSGVVAFRADPAAPPRLMHLVGGGILASPNPVLTQIAVGAAPSAGPALTADQQLIVDTHNRERQNYPGVGALQWSPELAQWAQEWAQSVANANVMTHRQDQRGNPFRPGEGLGENIYGWNPAKTGGDAVLSWIAEKQWYDYAQNTCAPGKVCGHYTQVVWKTSQYVGCGNAKSANGTLYYVCNYYPAGNNGGRPY